MKVAQKHLRFWHWSWVLGFVLDLHKKGYCPTTYPLCAYDILVGLHSPVLSNSSLSLAQQPFEGLLVQNECPPQGGSPQGGPGFLWSPARQSQLLLQRAQEECCTPWCSPAKGQGQSLPGSALHTSVTGADGLVLQPMEQNIMWCLSPTSQSHLQLSPAFKAKLVLLSLGLQEDLVTTFTLCLWHKNQEALVPQIARRWEPTEATPTGKYNSVLTHWLFCSRYCLWERLLLSSISGWSLSSFTFNCVSFQFRRERAN